MKTKQQAIKASNLIDRQAAIDALAKFVPYAICDESTESYTNGLTDAYNLICQLPSAEPEIIRCKDCSNWIPGYITDNDDFIPPECGKYRQMVGHSSDDYCSLSERRTDENNNSI